MAKRVKPEDMSSEMRAILADYMSDMNEVVYDTIDDIAKDMLKEIKLRSPRSTGDYAKGWKIEKIDKTFNVKRILWNRTNYQIVHLLEHGHVGRDGGRVKAYPHIKPVEDKYEKKITEYFEKKLGRKNK